MEKDRQILRELIDLRIEYHKDDFGYDLIFEFNENRFFEGTEIVKKVFKETNKRIDKTESTNI